MISLFYGSLSFHSFPLFLLLFCASNFISITFTLFLSFLFPSLFFYFQKNILNFFSRRSFSLLYLYFLSFNLFSYFLIVFLYLYFLSFLLFTLFISLSWTFSLPILLFFDWFVKVLLDSLFSFCLSLSFPFLNVFYLFLSWSVSQDLTRLFLFFLPFYAGDI